MFTIGEFSRITGLSIKALRLYHEKGILIPHTVDEKSGYRHYTHEDTEKARIIKSLRDMEFPLADIQTIFDQGTTQEEILLTLKKQERQLREKVSNYTKIISALETIISDEQEALMAYQQETFEVQEKVISDQLIAGIRYKGKYCDCGKYFAQIGRKMGWLISGKPFNLYYDCGYKETDADIETCMPVRKSKEVEGISIRTLPGGKCLSLVHKGPYDQLGRSYEIITAYAKEKGIEIHSPIREIYIKGPGMLFKGNPQKYLTEIQMMIEA